MDKCEVYHEQEKMFPMFNKYTGFTDGIYTRLIGVCYGTKEQEECYCGGDRAKCTFYKEKKKPRSKIKDDCMELKDTIEMMQSEDYKERFKAEYWQVRIRTEKLAKMLKDYEEGTLPFKPNCSYDLLNDQWHSMVTYYSILAQRAEVEGIDLFE